MLLPNLHSVLNSPNLKTLLVISESLDLLCLVEQLRPDDLECWYHTGTDTALGNFTVQGLGIDAFLSCNAESLQLWTRSKQIEFLHEALNSTPASVNILRRVKLKIQQDQSIVQAFQERRINSIRAISSIVHTDFVRPTLSDTRTANLFRKAFHSTKEDLNWSLHPVQQGWALRRYDGYTVDNTALFDVFTQHLSKRKRGSIITTSIVPTHTSWMQVPTEKWQSACSKPNTIAGLGPNGQWISQIDYFSFHDPLLQLTYTIETSINIMRTFQKISTRKD